MFNTFFYFTILFTVCSAKKTLKSILHRERLRIIQETFQIALFASMFLSLVKKTVLNCLFTVLSYAQGALQKRIGTDCLTEYFFFSINMNYTLNRKCNKYSSSFDIYLTKWGKNEKYKFYIYQLNIIITHTHTHTHKYLGILQ